jgi:hypothetical protein
MSNTTLQPDPDALRESAIAVITYVSDAMNEGVALLREHNRLLVENQGEHRLESEIQAINENLRHVNQDLEKIRTKSRQLMMTIISPMKAGKSTIINAIVGQDILPSRTQAMTTLPTEIVFSKEVTEPKLKLRYDGADTFDVLNRSWRSLKGKIKQIGLTQAKESTKDYPHLQYLIEDVAGNPELSFLPETSGTEPIQTALTKLNDLVRLCSVLVPSDNALRSLVSVPRLEVPFPERFKLDGVGKLVFVDTPGPNEAGDLKLDDVVECQLKASSIILLVLDYTQLNTEASEKVKSDVDEIATIRGLESIYVLINKIDMRREKDMTKQQVLEFVNSKFGIEASTDRVFEISASRAAYASNFWNEKKKGFTSPQDMKTSDFLGGLYYGDSWRKKFQEKVDMADMEEAASDVWSESGFAEFLEKTIAPSVTNAVPQMIAIKGTLNDNSDRFDSFFSCLSKDKRILEQDVLQLNRQTNQLEIDLNEVVKICDNNGWEKYISASLLRKFSAVFQQSLDKNKEILKQYLSLERKYVQFLDKTANLERNLKYQQKYFDNIK